MPPKSAKSSAGRGGRASVSSATDAAGSGKDRYTAIRCSLRSFDVDVPDKSGATRVTPRMYPIVVPGGLARVSASGGADFLKRTGSGSTAAFASMTSFASESVGGLSSRCSLSSASGAPADGAVMTICSSPLHIPNQKLTCRIQLEEVRADTGELVRIVAPSSNSNHTENFGKGERWKQYLKQYNDMNRERKRQKQQEHNSRANMNDREEHDRNRDRCVTLSAAVVVMPNLSTAVSPKSWQAIKDAESPTNRTAQPFPWGTSKTGGNMPLADVKVTPTRPQSGHSGISGLSGVGGGNNDTRRGSGELIGNVGDRSPRNDSVRPGLQLRSPLLFFFGGWDGVSRVDTIRVFDTMAMKWHSVNTSFVHVQDSGEGDEAKSAARPSSGGHSKPNGGETALKSSTSKYNAMQASATPTEQQQQQLPPPTALVASTFHTATWVPQRTAPSTKGTTQSKSSSETARTEEKRAGAHLPSLPPYALHGSILLFGGNTDAHHGGARLLSLDLTTFQWTAAVSGGATTYEASPRSSHIAGLIGQRFLVIYGGRRSATFDSDASGGGRRPTFQSTASAHGPASRLQSAASTKKRNASSIQLPPARQPSGAFLDSPLEDAKVLGDLAVYDVVLQRWTNEVIYKSRTPRPPPRYGHAATVVNLQHAFDMRDTDGNDNQIRGGAGDGSRLSSLSDSPANSSPRDSVDSMPDGGSMLASAVNSRVGSAVRSDPYARWKSAGLDEFGIRDLEAEGLLVHGGIGENGATLNDAWMLRLSIAPPTRPVSPGSGGTSAGPSGRPPSGVKGARPPKSGKLSANTDDAGKTGKQRTESPLNRAGGEGRSGSPSGRIQLYATWMPVNVAASAPSKLYSVNDTATNKEDMSGAAAVAASPSTTSLPHRSGHALACTLNGVLLTGGVDGSRRFATKDYMLNGLEATLARPLSLPPLPSTRPESSNRR